MQEAPISTAIVANPLAGPVLTLDKLREVMREGQEKLDKLNDELVEWLLVAGFRVVINEEMPDGMVAVLPGNFKGSLRRAMEKLRAGDRRFGVIHSLNWMA